MLRAFRATSRIDLMQAIRHAAALSFCLILAACGRPSADAMAAAGVSPLPQHFEITIDGTMHTLSPDDPNVSVVVASVMESGKVFSLGALDQSRNLGFTILLKETHIAPGAFPVGDCPRFMSCSTGSRTAVLAPYPDGKVPDPLSGKFAYDYPDLGLKPGVLTLAQVDDAMWPGVGPAKRIRGSFKGDLASVDRGPDGKARVIGPLKQVEVRFELYAAVK